MIMDNRFELFSGLVNSAYKSLQKLKRMNMERFGLSGAHTNCLYRLLEAEDTGLSQRDLMELEQMDKAQVSRVLKDLEKKGYVTTKGTAGYKAAYVLTEDGRDIAFQVRKLVDTYLVRIGESMSEERRKTFYEAFELVVADLEAAIQDME
ncbi:MAG: MarR family transcriptional regulator [Lachnospiraceae bacterium]|jgi:DNA-binding MarR family transcriptional regulator|nr:MarR family transcriptional regulator [Lachnospiraceae bacterium]